MIDFTQIIIATVGGLFTIITAVAVALINSKIQNKQDRDVLDATIAHSLGAMQQAVQTGIHDLHPQIQAMNLDPNIAVALQYVSDHAGDEMDRLGYSSASIADKINAHLGLANIATNLATASSPAPTPAPLAAVLPPVIAPALNVPLAQVPTGYSGKVTDPRPWQP